MNVEADTRFTLNHIFKKLLQSHYGPLSMSLSIPELVTCAKDIVLALAALVTAGVAVAGLTTWNRQLRGSARFETARSMAKAAYMVRDRLQACRSPLLLAQEFPADYHEAGPTRSPEVEAKGYAFLYSQRWLPVFEAMQEFDTSVLAAEALWGQPIRDAADELRSVVREVGGAIHALIANAASGGQDFRDDREFGKRMRSTVSGSPTNSENELNKKLDAAIHILDARLRPHLRRN